MLMCYYTRFTLPFTLRFFLFLLVSAVPESASSSSPIGTSLACTFCSSFASANPRSAAVGIDPATGIENRVLRSEKLQEHHQNVHHRCSPRQGDELPYVLSFLTFIELLQCRRVRLLSCYVAFTLSVMILISLFLFDVLSDFLLIFVCLSGFRYIEGGSSSLHMYYICITLNLNLDSFGPRSV